MSNLSLKIKTHKGRELPIIALRRPARPGHPIFNRGPKEMIGVSSCRGFPFKHEWLMSQVCGWCHCFRNPEEHGITGVPTALISESDFISVTNVDAPKTSNHDFIWACKGTNTQKTSKNAELLHKCLPVFQEMGLTGFVVGWTDPSLVKQYGPRIKFMPPQTWRKLMNRLRDCKFAFFPNLMDASPRFMAEALSLNIPVVVNEGIYGGWKYVNENTGRFFNSEEDVKEAVLDLYDSKELSPQEWWRAHYGPRRASKKLGAFISQIRPDLDVHRAYFS